ncbi:DNA cytosine methyltransferase [Chloroflexota bacterium]
MTMPIHVFDFFSGCGGTCQGFQDAGMVIMSAIDNDNDSQATFHHNFPNSSLHSHNIEDIAVEDLQLLVNQCEGHPILFSVSAPCQPYTNQKTNKALNDPRLNLLDEFTRFAEHYLPDYVFLENVPGLQRITSEDNPFNRLLTMLENNGYESNYDIIRARDYGVPQRRKRLVLIASRHGVIHFPPKTHGPNTEHEEYSKVVEWMSDLPSIEAGTSDSTVPNHIAAALTPINYRRIVNTSINGGGRGDWPDELKLTCHSNGYKGHTDVYGRMSWDSTASCLTTRCTSISNGRFGHPEQNRAISAREAACLQTFPRDFVFFGGITSMARQIGNAVPPLLAQRFGEAFNNHFLHHREE